MQANEIQIFSTETSFFNRGNIECGDSFIILLFDTCQVEDLQFFIMFLNLIEYRIKMIESHYEHGGSVKTTYKVRSKTNENELK